MTRRALVVGGLSQAGRLLMKSLVMDGYQVLATTRRGVEAKDVPRDVGMIFNVDFSQGGNSCRLHDQILSFHPDEIYNLASIMYAPASWERPVETYEVNLLPCVQILHSIKELRDIAFVQAGSAEMFKKSLSPIGRDSPIAPTSPYGISKLAAYVQVSQSRMRYGTRACTAILFNMESGDRNDFFFARKAVLECVRVFKEHRAGKDPVQMTFGPLGARRDWGLAREYVEVMRAMATDASSGAPTDRIVGTGEMHTCYEFIRECLTVLGIPQYWPVILNETKEGVPSQAYDCMYASPSDMAEMGIRLTGFSSVVRELVEEELRKSG